MAGFDQTLRPFLWRAERLYPDREIVTRTPEGRRRSTYAEYGDRVRRLASALDVAGVDRGDRVGTVCWNHDRHFETYFAVPKTATGKFSKKDLREEFADEPLIEGQTPDARE